jgi:hypothetical protein
VLVDGQPGRATPALRTGGWWVREVAVDLPAGATTTVRVDLDGLLPAPEAPYGLQLRPGGGVTPDDYKADVTVGDHHVRFTGRVVATTDAG